MTLRGSSDSLRPWGAGRKLQSAAALRKQLAALHCETIDIPAGTLLWRVYSRGGSYPVDWRQMRSWGPNDSCRFDHHELPPRVQSRSIYYAAEHPHCALAEVFGERGLIHVRRDEPALAQFATATDLVLCDLTETWIHRAGGDYDEILSGDRETARAWSAAIYETYPHVQGLYYRSTWNHEWKDVALFERAVTALPSRAVADVSLSDAAVEPIVKATAALYDWRVEGF